MREDALLLSLGGAAARSDGRAFWLVNPAVARANSQLRDSAGIAPDFPRLVANQIVRPSIGMSFGARPAAASPAAPSVALPTRLERFRRSRSAQPACGGAREA